MRLMFCAVAAAMLWGCSDGGKQLLETARFEEKQGNRPHAVQLYGDIVKKFPDSAAAREAAERLKALEQK